MIFLSICLSGKIMYWLAALGLKYDYVWTVIDLIEFRTKLTHRLLGTFPFLTRDTVTS